MSCSLPWLLKVDKSVPYKKENAIKYYKLAVELNPGDTEYAKRVLINSKDKLRELGVEK